MNHHKVDLVMWSKRGPPKTVLEQLAKVIPNDVVSKRLLVVDSISDIKNTAYRDFSWDVLINTGIGISGASNTAFDNVESNSFISFEDDIFLANDWWDKIPKLVDNKITAVASGIRIPDKPTSIKRLQEYTTARYQKETKMKTGFLYGKTLDNTIYRTDLLRKIGGFPKLKIDAGVDNALAKRLDDSGLGWKVDFDVRSVHLRRGLGEELKHYYWYGTCQRELKKELGGTIDDFLSILLRTGFSPLRGLQVAYKQKCWQISYVYPLIRTCIFLGVLRGYL